MTTTCHVTGKISAALCDPYRDHDDGMLEGSGELLYLLLRSLQGS